MITLIEVLNYRCLRYVRAPLGRFSLLVGPSGSGKSTLMDVPALLSDLVRLGPEAAAAARASDPRELVWNGEGDSFELAVEATLPGGVPRHGDPPMDSVRYQVEVRVGADGGAELSSETLMLTRGAASAPEPAATMFPVHPAVPRSILSSVQRHDNRAVVNRGPGGTDYFHPEAGGDRDGQWDPSFPLGPRRSALGHLIDDAESYPAATWMRDLLSGGIGRLSPDPGAMRGPDRPHRGGAAIAADGSNLPGLVDALRRDHPGRHREWVRRLATVVAGLSDVRAAPCPPEGSATLVYSYEGGRSVPARLASSGELRLSALALAAHLPGPPRLHLVEGPETDLHEGALAAVLEWLRATGDSQVAAATHSAVLEAGAEREELLRLSRTEDGGTLLTAGAGRPDPAGDAAAEPAPEV